MSTTRHGHWPRTGVGVTSPGGARSQDRRRRTTTPEGPRHRQLPATHLYLARRRNRSRPVVRTVLLPAHVRLLHPAPHSRRVGDPRRRGVAPPPLPGHPGRHGGGRAGGGLARAPLPADGLPAPGPALLRGEPGVLLPGAALRRGRLARLVGPRLLRVAERLQPGRAVPLLVLHGRRLRIRAQPSPLRRHRRGRNRGRHLRRRPDHVPRLPPRPAQPAAGGHGAHRGRRPLRGAPCWSCCR